MVEEGCRIDVWLWRTRFFKTRALAAKVVAAGAVRLTRAGRSERVAKPAKTLRLGDELIFAFAGRLRAVRVEAIGGRRGPSCEARALYSTLENSSPQAAAIGIDKGLGRFEEQPASRLEVAAAPRVRSR